MLELALPEFLGLVCGEHESSKLRLLTFHVRERGVTIRQEGARGKVNRATNKANVRVRVVACPLSGCVDEPCVCERRSRRSLSTLVHIKAELGTRLNLQPLHLSKQAAVCRVFSSEKWCRKISTARCKVEGL